MPARVLWRSWLVVQLDAVEIVRPVFAAMGKTITHVGDSGAGQIAKAANQIMVAAQMVAMGELLIFAKKAGADPQKVVEAIKGGQLNAGRWMSNHRVFFPVTASPVSKPTCKPKT